MSASATTLWSPNLVAVISSLSIKRGNPIRVALHAVPERCPIFAVGVKKLAHVFGKGGSVLPNSDLIYNLFFHDSTGAFLKKNAAFLPFFFTCLTAQRNTTIWKGGPLPSPCHQVYQTFWLLPSRAPHLCRWKSDMPFSFSLAPPPFFLPCPAPWCTFCEVWGDCNFISSIWAPKSSCKLVPQTINMHYFFPCNHCSKCFLL